MSAIQRLIDEAYDLVAHWERYPRRDTEQTGDYIAAVSDALRALMDEKRQAAQSVDSEKEALRQENEKLRADLKAMEGFADLWYFVSDEAPLDFEKIVAEYSPSRWLTEANKLRTAKRGG